MSKRKIVRVRDVMKSQIDWVDGTDTVQSALQKMQYQESHALIVNKRDEDDEYGLVLLSDIAKKVIAKDRYPERVNIYEIMSKPVICVRSEMDVRYCARLFDSFGLAVAPVSEGNTMTLIGLVSYNDIVIKGFET